MANEPAGNFLLRVGGHVSCESLGYWLEFLADSTLDVCCFKLDRQVPALMMKSLGYPTMLFVITGHNDLPSLRDGTSPCGSGLPRQQ